jgi:glucuronoarabinoxylan endo-1,4-beta-xylanase
MRRPVGILLGIVALLGILVALQVSIHKRNPQIAKVSPAVTVDYGSKKQIIRGFGGSTGWLGPLTTQQATALFNQMNGLGLSILRVRIDPEGSASNKWVTSQWTDELTNATEAIAANPNAIVMATPWTPPPAFKTGSATGEPYANCNNGLAQGYCGGSLDPSHYADYASYLKDFIDYFQSNGVKLYAISIQNEPDASVQYESCFWSQNSDLYNHTSNAGSAMDRWIAGNASVVTATGTKLIMPESEDFKTSFATDSLNDPNAASQIGIIAGHAYGDGENPFYYTQAESAGKEVWMTEHWLNASGSSWEHFLNPSGSSSNLRDAISAAEEVHNSMVTGQYNAYVWWWIWNDPAAADGVTYGLINSSTTNPAPTYFGDAIGQFSKFVQPGYYRYNMSGSPSSGIYVSAYSGADNAGVTHYVIVAINENSTAVSQTFTIDNATVTSMTPYQTSSAGGLKPQPAVSVSGGMFTYNLPAESITTFAQ